MMTCREAATILSSGSVTELGLVRRAWLVIHLAICRNCRAFRRQIAWLDAQAARLGSSFEAESPAGLEQRIRERVTGPRP